MYRVIAYHGKGSKKEIADDLRLLWEELRNFAGSRELQHVYCFQSVKDTKGADVLMIVNYRDGVGSGDESRQKTRGSAPDITSPAVQERVDYWFYVRGE